MRRSPQINVVTVRHRFHGMKHGGQPPCGLLTLNLRSHWSNPREESINKSMVVDQALVFGSPARACTGMDIEPTTPCNNPTDFVALRQLRKFALSASSEGQTLRSAALRAAIC